MDMLRVYLQIVQSVSTKPRIYLAYASQQLHIQS